MDGHKVTCREQLIGDFPVGAGVQVRGAESQEGSASRGLFWDEHLQGQCKTWLLLPGICWPSGMTPGIAGEPLPHPGLSMVLLLKWGQKDRGHFGQGRMLPLPPRPSWTLYKAPSPFLLLTPFLHHLFHCLGYFAFKASLPLVKQEALDSTGKLSSTPSRGDLFPFLFSPWVERGTPATLFHSFF